MIGLFGPKDVPGSFVPKKKEFGTLQVDFCP
jgi:hypothetical protein